MISLATRLATVALFHVHSAYTKQPEVLGKSSFLVLGFEPSETCIRFFFWGISAYLDHLRSLYNGIYSIATSSQ